MPTTPSDALTELRDVLREIDAVLEYDEPHRVARMMTLITPLIQREFGGCSGWGSELAAKGFSRMELPTLKD